MPQDEAFDYYLLSECQPFLDPRQLRHSLSHPSTMLKCLPQRLRAITSRTAIFSHSIIYQVPENMQVSQASEAILCGGMDRILKGRIKEMFNFVQTLHKLLEMS